MIKVFIPFLLIIFSMLSGAVYAYPVATITIKVVDESGLPISGAEAGVNFELPKDKGPGVAINRKSATTDADGLVTLSGETTSQVTISASHQDYYSSSLKYRGLKTVKGYLWFKEYEAKNPIVTIVLKKKMNPIAMFAVNMSLMKDYPQFPLIGEFVGFDLIAKDWVAPYGLGVNQDILFKLEIRRAVSPSDYDNQLLIKFPKRGDGLISFSPDESKGKSILRLPHKAPVSGYTPELSRRYQREPGQIRYSEGGNPEYDTNYFLRVQTELDAEGNVINALYGKIHGDINIGNPGWLHEETPYVGFNYYINPTENDSNIEFDTEKNLFKGLSRNVKVLDP